MTKNVGTRDRLLRVVAAIPLTVCAFTSPLSLPLRLMFFVPPALYLLVTAARGWCVGYSLTGKSTCDVARLGS